MAALIEERGGSQAERVLGWKAEYDLDAICAHAWLWQSNNPEGFVAGKA